MRPPSAIPRLLAMLLLALLTANAVGQHHPAETREHHGAITGDLAEALGAVAVQLRVPIVAELALPLPHGFDIAEGDDSVEHLLNSFVVASPDYGWEWDGRVAHVYNRRLLDAPADFLNLRFDSFLLPGNVAELNVLLRNAIWQCNFQTQPADHRTCPVPVGGVFAGIWPTELERLRLTPRRMVATSARRVVLEAANDSGQFYAIVVFPRENASTPQDAEFAFFHWAWPPLSDTAKPFAAPFSWYGRVFRIQPDLLLENVITPVAISRRRPNARVSIIVNERGRVERVSVLKGHVREAAMRTLRSWRFKPYHLNGLPAKVHCELPVEIGKDGSVHPATASRTATDQ